MAGTTVTTLAKKKMVKARAGISSLPKIVGMAFGDGGVDSGGTVKPHSADQNTLHHELLRKNVDGSSARSNLCLASYFPIIPWRKSWKS